LARLLQVRDPSSKTPASRPGPTTLDVTLEELTRYHEGGLLDPGRRQAVERFLRAHFPEALPPESDVPTWTELDQATDTEVSMDADETGIDPPPEDG
jgi:hypothetical protein